MVLGVQTQHRRGTAAQWSASGKILADGELGLATDTKILKMGDGVNEWDDLPVAFSDYYLSAGGTAVNSLLLGGISSSGFVKVADATTAATGDKVAKRFSDGRLKAATGLSTDDVANVAQMVAADTAAVATARSILISRTVTADFTLQVGDVGGTIFVNGASYSPNIICTVPTNATAAIPVGSRIDIRTASASKSPVLLTTAGGVSVTGSLLIYGGGSSLRLYKSGTDTWVVMHTNQSPGPILRRKVKIGAGGATLGSGFTKIRLDGANLAGAAAITNNADTLGTNEQYDAATDIYKCYVRRSGWYDVQGQVTVNETYSGRIYCTLYVNNTAVPIGGSMAKNSLPDVGARFVDLLPFNVGDYVEMYAFREAGTTGTVVETNDSPSYFAWAWRRPL